MSNSLECYADSPGSNHEWQARDGSLQGSRMVIDRRAGWRWLAQATLETPPPLSFGLGESRAELKAAGERGSEGADGFGAGKEMR